MEAIVAFSEQCEAKLVHVVLLLYLVVSSALQTLAILVAACKSEKRAAKLHLLAAGQSSHLQTGTLINFMTFLATITVDHLASMPRGAFRRGKKGFRLA